MDAAQNKAKTMRIVKIWCDHCKSEHRIETKPQDKEVKYCPCCRRKILVESIRYV